MKNAIYELHFSKTELETFDNIVEAVIFQAEQEQKGKQSTLAVDGESIEDAGQMVRGYLRLVFSK